MIALRLAKSGWWGASVGSVMDAPADEVLAAVHYEVFVGEYEAETMALARREAESRRTS